MRITLAAAIFVMIMFYIIIKISDTSYHNGYAACEVKH